ncbi:MAG TPA: response regulator [Steroidobacteraceae bacterium]|nr:response regulator [Steroidobacteraceae bacterium]
MRRGFIGSKLIELLTALRTSRRRARSTTPPGLEGSPAAPGTLLASPPASSDTPAAPAPPPERPRISHARARDAQLRRSADFLEFAQAAGGFGVYDLNLISGDISGTPLFFELLGQTSRELTLSREEWVASIHPEDLETVVIELGAAIDAGAKYQSEYRTLLLNGEVRWLSSSGQVLKDAEGYPARVIGTLCDITVRKQLEEKLRYATESLNIAQAAAGLATFDFNFARNSRICSDNFHTLLGIPPSTKLDDLNLLLSRVHPDDVARSRSAPLETTPEEPSYRCEYRVLLNGGGERWIGEKATVSRGPEGEVTRITGAIVEISDLKRAEQATLDAKLAAEAANRAKSDFLANVSHEIRTPMNGVIGMSQILAETQLDNTQREYVDIIRGSANALLSLINDVLDLSKIEAGRLELEHVDFDLRDVIYETVAATALQSAVKGIELIVNIGTDMPVLVRGDPGRLRQIIMNLIGNATKFTHEGHVILDATGALSMSGRVQLRLEVTDTGIGIPADRLDRLFKSFSQIDSSTTRHYGGTGLGLSIVKRLAELMGGTVGVRSEVGRGSSFHVTLEIDALENQPHREPLGRGRRILIVDDLAASRASLAAKLELASFDTVAVSSVDAALQQLAQETRFDLVLADELMPMKGGHELLSAMRASPRCNALPFVLLSLFGVERDASDYLHRPDAVALKPIRAHALIALVDQVLNGNVSHNLPVTPEQPESPTFRGRRILLVEDNPVNQHVAQRVLQKLAAQVTLANNGAEALERIAETTYDAVLMDCRMPVMDGFTATRRIRDLEQASGHGRRLPIIALTANVMSEDRDSCIAAGMDAHLGKPIEPGQLLDCLSRYLKPDAARSEVDMAALRELTGGDAQFERELVATFITSGDQCLAEIHAALNANDFATIGKRAHALKGASANIYAAGLSAAASSLESAARANSAREIDGLVQNLNQKLQAVNAELRKAG